MFPTLQYPSYTAKVKKQLISVDDKNPTLSKFVHDHIFKSNYLHLQIERNTRHLKSINFKVHSYSGRVVSFKYIFTKPENITNKSNRVKNSQKPLQYLHDLSVYLHFAYVLTSLSFYRGS